MNESLFYLHGKNTTNISNKCLSLQIRQLEKLQDWFGTMAIHASPIKMPKRPSTTSSNKSSMLWKPTSIILIKNLHSTSNVHYSVVFYQYIVKIICQKRFVRKSPILSFSSPKLRTSTSIFLRIHQPSLIEVSHIQKTSNVLQKPIFPTYTGNVHNLKQWFTKDCRLNCKDKIRAHKYFLQCPTLKATMPTMRQEEDLGFIVVIYQECTGSGILCYKEFFQKQPIYSFLSPKLINSLVRVFKD